jgi:hypothetical protein
VFDLKIGDREVKEIVVTGIGSDTVEYCGQSVVAVISDDEIIGATGCNVYFAEEEISYVASILAKDSLRREPQKRLEVLEEKLAKIEALIERLVEEQ